MQIERWEGNWQDPWTSSYSHDLSASHSREQNNISVALKEILDLEQTVLIGVVEEVEERL